MKFAALVALSVLCARSVPTLNAGSEKSTTAAVVERYGRLPLVFEENRGQSDTAVRFIARGPGYLISLTNIGAVLTVTGGSARSEEPNTSNSRSPDATTQLQLKLLGANANTRALGEEILPGKSNYIRGRNPKLWHTSIPQYAKVHYTNVYPGVDVMYYGNHSELEWDFIVKPGANARAIRLAVEGADEVAIEDDDLVLTQRGSKIRLRRPRAYQEVDGVKHDVSVEFRLDGHNVVSLELGTYDRSANLIVDPVLAYSSGVGFPEITGVALDGAGNTYVAGMVFTGSGVHDVAVTKINADGTAIVYSTIFGGTGDEYRPTLAVGVGGSVVVTGTTQSTDFPVINALQTFNPGGSAFVVKINSKGDSFIYSTYLGGSLGSSGSGVAIDSSGNAYVTGTTGSDDFPTINAFQSSLRGSNDVYITKLNSSGNAYLYSTYLGGSGTEESGGIAIDLAGNVYVTGRTDSTDFPTLNPLQGNNHGNSDVFLSKLGLSGKKLIYSTYLGGSSSDIGSAIKTDSAGSVYLLGSTISPDFPTVNAFQSENRNWDMFITKVKPDGETLSYSTYLGGTLNDIADNFGSSTAMIAVDSLGSAYVTGTTESSDFPIVNSLPQFTGGGQDAIVSRISPSGTLDYSMRLGGTGADQADGVAVDSLGSAYVAVESHSVNFPTTSAAISTPSYGGVLVKVALQTSVSVLPLKMAFKSQLVGTASAGQKVKVTNHGATTLNVKKVYIAGRDPADFSVTNNCGAALIPGETCTALVTFKPTVSGARKAAVAVSDSDPASPQATALTATGTVLRVVPTALSFADQSVGTVSAAKVLTVTNTSTNNVKLTSVAIAGANAGDFSQTNTCGTSIAAGAGCTISVQFAPSVIGARNAVVKVTVFGGGSPQSAALTGTGI